ncbi:hypothetical protein RHGRI_032627 [Rhododendron griersonianum]|uniref:PRKR-interacting protein 1 n=1 Tax=Rhododendron griersonianum TaxID=479676 RepID=A0AAV6IHD2_9ERIC|nr:hypothetical protein RHGRI_032627 [Rhododendron griersonianum]
MLSGRPAAAADGDMRLVAVPEKQTLALPPRPPAAGSNALVEYTPPVPNPEEEDLEYRQMRRKEQDRLARMDADYQKRQELAEFNKKRDERVKAAEERTAKNRLKRQKKKQRKKVKKSKLNAGGEEHQTEAASDDDGDSDNDEEAEV